MKLKTGIFLGVGVIVAGLVAVPFLLPLDTYRGPIEAAAKAATGRDVHIRGPLHLAIYPQLGISLSDVTIANAPGAQEPEMVSVGSVVVGAELMPLFSRRLEVTEIVLEKPVIHLEVDRSGSPNWILTTPPSSTGQQGRPAAGGNAPANGTAGNFGFRSVRIDGGELNYRDARSNAAEALTDISVQIDMPGGNARGLTGPLNLTGALTYHGEPLKLAGHVDNVSAVLAGRPTGLRVNVASNVVNADFSGTLANDGRVSGALKLGAHSVRSLASWLGHPMPPGNGFGLMALDGQFSAAGGVYTLKQTNLAFDQMNLNADMSIDTNSDVLGIKGKVTINRLDVTPYLAPGTAQDTVQAAKAKAADPNAPLALDWLKAANADMTLVLGGLVVPNFKLDHAVVAVALHGGVLKADFSSVAAYGGNGKGTVLVDASKDEPTFRETLDISGLKAQPFLNDLMGVNRINSTGAVRLDLSARGNSESEIVKALNGKGSVRFNDGYISGVNLAAVARVLQSVLSTEALTGVVGDNQKTEFGEMGGTFAVRNGVLSTNDLSLVSSAVELNGKGTVDLSAHQLDFRFEPKAKRGIPGIKLVDIGVPFQVKGPWDNPSYTPDAGGIAKNVVNRLGEDAKLPIDVLKDPTGTLKSLFGSGK